MGGRCHEGVPGGWHCHVIDRSCAVAYALLTGQCRVCCLIDTSLCADLRDNGLTDPVTNG